MWFRIKIFFKEMFCKHMWKVTKEEHLWSGGRYMVGVRVGDAQCYASYQRCIKCGKKRIEEIMMK